MEYDFRSLVDQLFGKKNIFGYAKTIINQAAMVYWFLGDFYQSKIFNRYLTRFWVLFNIISLTLLFGHCFAYIIFSSNLDISKMLFACQIIISISYLNIATPFSSHIYRKSIVKTFRVLDHTNTYELETRHLITAETSTKSNLNAAYGILFTQISLFSSYMTFTFLRLIIGYNTDKLSDPDYFVYPLFSENVDQLSTFIMLQISQIVSSMPVAFMLFLVPFFPMILSNKFYDKFRALTSLLKQRSDEFKYHIEKLLASSSVSTAYRSEILKAEQLFVMTIKSHARYHHDLLRGISEMRPYLEFNMSTNLFSFLYVEILLIYIITLIEEEPILLKMRVVANVTIIGTIQFVYCFIGKSLSDMGEMFCDAVYDIPWYYLSPSGRKSVHLLLNQAQINMQCKALRIYPLNMGFFLKSCNNVYSMVNLLRRTTSKI